MPEEGGIGLMTIINPVAVYSDPCHPTDGFYPGPVDTVDGFVTALTEQQGWAEVTAPSDISVDGYVGKAFQRTAPADMSAAPPGRRVMRLFGCWGPSSELGDRKRGTHMGTHRARSRRCGSSTSTARSSSSARHRGRDHRRRIPVSPTRCSTRSASTGGERRFDITPGKAARASSRRRAIRVAVALRSPEVLRSGTTGRPP